MSKLKEATKNTENDRYHELIGKIHLHDYRYWTINSPIISDEDYDKLVRELHEIESVNGVSPGSPSLRRSGVLLSGFDEVPHIEPMKSLAKIFDEKELEAKLLQLQSEAGTETELAWMVEPK